MSDNHCVNDIKSNSQRPQTILKLVRADGVRFVERKTSFSVASASTALIRWYRIWLLVLDLPKHIILK